MGILRQGLHPLSSSVHIYADDILAYQISVTVKLGEFKNSEVGEVDPGSL